jgi:L-aspartate oxidase
MRTLETEFAVVGSGVAGLRAAIELARSRGRVLLVSKDPVRQSATGWARGGVAAALGDDDEIALHYHDTLRAGDGLCRPAAVRALVGEGPAAIRQLLRWGARFDREGSRLAFGREAAHSRRRIVHAHGDSTGREILRTLVERASDFPGIERVASLFTLDLLLERGRVVGLSCLDERGGGPVRVLARAVLLATGGLGQLYRDTTNPPVATGDGVAMALRAGAAVADLEFVQFHPTALWAPGQPRHLLTEALRGEGAVLLNARGERFLAGRLPGAELAPRDRVSRAIEEELCQTGEQSVYLDLAPVGRRRLAERFPHVLNLCREAGLDPRVQPVPVRPAAHYAMGGVHTDLWGRSSLEGLFAAGECACAGVHGANRLASNSLLEGLVFGARAARAMLAVRGGSARRGVCPEHDCVPSRRAERAIRRLQGCMWEDVGVVRERAGLERALRRLRSLAQGRSEDRVSRRGAEARNLRAVALAVARLALWRRESRGAHFRSDFPRKSRRYRRHSWLRLPAAAGGAPIPAGRKARRAADRAAGRAPALSG